jgi:AraC-like DNA-binding protein/mannose-6-phosphate isomerase-like protein (cupin superfamily)
MQMSPYSVSAQRRHEADTISGPLAAAERATSLQTCERSVAGMAAHYPDGSASTRHAHRRGQFTFNLSGVTSLLTDEGSFVVPPGFGIWIPPGTVHQSRCWGEVRIQTIYVSPDAIPAYPPRFRLMQTSPLLRALIDEVVRLPDDPDETGREERIVHLLLDEIDRMPDVLLHVPVPQDPRLARICRAVLADTSADGTLDAWAGLVGISRRTLTRLFRQETGSSFVEWQQKARLLEALARLGAGERVTQVALDVGYDSPSAFTAMFKRVLGAPPRCFLRWTDSEVVMR